MDIEGAIEPIEVEEAGTVPSASPFSALKRGRVYD